MADQCTWGVAVLGLVAFYNLGLFALYNFVMKNKSDTDGDSSQNKSACLKNALHAFDGACRSDSNAEAVVIIVGASVAGAALAHTLGKDGHQVHVIERDLSEPERIVGELLQPGGYPKLIELGLEDCVGVSVMPLFMNGKTTQLSYPLEKFHSDVAGRSLHNVLFIQSLREKAASLPNVRLEQGTVTSLVEEKGTIKDVPSCFVGLVLENCNLPFANHRHVILADPSPILCYPISSNEVRCLVDIAGQKVPSSSNGEMAKYLKTVVAPQIPPKIYDSSVAAIEKGNIRTPRRSMPAAPYPIPGALLMGDAFNMRHPLTGGGMIVALLDIVILRNLLRPLHNLNDALALSKYLESFYTLRKPVSSTINTLASALYQVFSASPDEARK